MKRTRIERPFKTYALGKDGKRRLLDGAYGLVIELRPGIEVELDLAPHPNHDGELVMMTPRPRRMKRLFDQGIIDTFAVMFGGENVLHVSVERRRASRR